MAVSINDFDKAVVYGLTNINDPTTHKPILVDSQGRVILAGTGTSGATPVEGITGGVPVPTAEAPRAGAAADTATGSAAAATLTYAAVASLKHCISGIYWSYNGTPTGGNLKIDDVSGTTVFSVDITAAGPGFLPFPAAIKAAAVNTAMIVTLASGGAGVTGRVNARHWTEI